MSTVPVKECMTCHAKTRNTQAIFCWQCGRRYIPKNIMLILKGIVIFMKKILTWNIIGIVLAICVIAFSTFISNTLGIIAAILAIIGCGFYITDQVMVDKGHNKKWPKIVKISALWAGVLLFALSIGLILSATILWIRWFIFGGIILCVLGKISKIIHIVLDKPWLKTVHKAVFFPGVGIFGVGLILAIILNYTSISSSFDLPSLPSDATTDSIISNDIGWIEYSVDGKNWTKANELTGDYGHRVAFTCAQALFPNATWDYKYSGDDWKKIENTWVDVQVSVPNGAIARVWCFSWKQGTQIHDGGYLMELSEGYYEFSIKNGEAQNWDPDDSYFSIDLNRIFTQVRDGNVNVKNALAFSSITTNLKDKVPSDLKYNEITVGPAISTK